MKESLATALTGTGSMQDSEVNEVRVDRVRAAAAAQMPEVHRAQMKSANQALKDANLCAMGRHAIAFRVGHCAASHEPLVEALSEWLSRRLRQDARAVAIQAIREWTVSMCPRCKGAAIVPDHDVQHLEGPQPMRNCPDCSGSGKRRWDEGERDMSRKAAQTVEVAKSILRQAETAITTHYGKLLGKGSVSV